MAADQRGAGGGVDQHGGQEDGEHPGPSHEADRRRSGEDADPGGQQGQVQAAQSLAQGGRRGVDGETHGGLVHPSPGARVGPVAAVQGTNHETGLHGLFQAAVGRQETGPARASQPPDRRVEHRDGGQPPAPPRALEGELQPEPQHHRGEDPRERPRNDGADHRQVPHPGGGVRLPAGQERESPHRAVRLRGFPSLPVERRHVLKTPPSTQKALEPDATRMPQEVWTPTRTERRVAPSWVRPVVLSRKG